MYLCTNGVTDRFIQYECMNVPQVKNTINELTKTVSTSNDWKDLCYSVKKQGSYDSCDYVYFDDKGENDCTICVAYDNNSKSYLVWAEI